MKNSILMMFIAASASMFSSCSTDDLYTDNANKYQTQNTTEELRPALPVVPPTVQTGTITGSFYPVVPAKACAINSKGIHYYGVIRDSGDFQISDVPVGSYIVCIIPKQPCPLLSITVPNVLVRGGQTTDIGDLSFYVEELSETVD